MKRFLMRWRPTRFVATAPDIVNMGFEILRPGVAQGLFRPLDELPVPPELDDYLADVDPRLLEAGELGGVRYLLPAEWNPMVIYYNTDLFAAAGLDPPPPDWTWEQFLEVATQLTDEATGITGSAIPAFNFGMAPWYSTNGTSPLSADQTASNLRDPAMAEAAQFVADLVNVQRVAPSIEGTDPYRLFADGQAAMTGGGRWLVAAYATQGFNAYDIAAWPRNRDSSTVYGMAGFAMHAASGQT